MTPHVSTITFPTNITSLIHEHIPLADKNWFQTGGLARYFCEPTSVEQVRDVLAWAKQHQVPVFMLGNGANILISDEGFDGLVIRQKLSTITVQYDKEQALVTAQAGVSIADLITFCLSNDILGLEEFSGIPGTIGGAIYINLHYFEFLIGQFLAHAHVIHAPTGTLQQVTRTWFNFSYNNSTLHAKEWYLIDATFVLKKAPNAYKTAYAQGRADEIIRHRARRYPTSHTCGSFFRAFLDHEVTLCIQGKKMTYAGYYLDKVGIKGNLRVGGAIVSYQHANMIVNTGNATTADIIDLARVMQELVYKDFGIVLRPECELVGFRTFPLHRFF